MPLYDARVILDVEQPGTAPGAALLFWADSRPVGLAIDDVFDPVLVEAQELRPMPGGGTTDAMMRGLVRRGGDLIAVLDGAALLDTMLAAASATGTEAI